MISLLFSLLSLSSFAGEVAQSTQAGTSSVSATATTSNSSPADQAAIELADCKPQVDPRTNTEEKFARNEAEKAGLSKEELLARLIYSEGLSTGYWKKKCNANTDDDIMKNIGWGIMNRVKTRASTTLDAYSDVIFGKNQFRTSFSRARANPFANAFLCPLKSQKYLDGATEKVDAKELYKKTQAIAESIIAEYERSGIPTTYKGITNFFYPYSEFFGEIRPEWAKDKDPSKNRGYLNILKVARKPCVESYKLR
ncbi:hypothetical protein [Bdellovibrio sp. HCB337]|uniref:hypothetical protein n=1 Tax=Bdellovibrio sp. HCB337 TaxID=3394358 RepID=UPI0039A4A4C8